MKQLVWHIIGLSVGLVMTSLMAFAIILHMPADPVDIAIQAWNLAATDETIAALRADWGLDLPFWQRYGIWITDFIQGDWGRSFQTGDAIAGEFMDRLPLSFLLGFGGLALALLLALPLGFSAAHRPNGFADHISRSLSIFVQAVPAFWTGLILLWVLGAKLQIIRPFSQDWPSILMTVLLAICLVSLQSLASFARVYRKALTDFKATPPYLTALSKGLSPAQALWQHGHRNGLYAVICVVYAEFAWIIGGSATIEILFNLPGISQFLVSSIGARDQFVMQSYIMVVAIWMLVTGFVVKSLQLLLDPRIS